MPVSPEHLSALGAYERLWRGDATDADIEAAFAPGFADHRPGAPGAGIAEFAGHRKAALDALARSGPSHPGTTQPPGQRSGGPPDTRQGPSTPG